MIEVFKGSPISQSIKRHWQAEGWATAAVEPQFMFPAQLQGRYYTKKTEAQKVSFEAEISLIEYLIYVRLKKYIYILWFTNSIKKDKLIFQYTTPIFNNSYILQWGCYFKDQGCLQYSENK